MIENVLFDFDGTLANSHKLQVPVLKKLFLQNGLEVDKIDFIPLIGPPLILTFEKFFGTEKAMDILGQYLSIYRQTEIKDVTLVTGIKNALKTLKNSGKKLYTTSLQMKEVCVRQLDFLGITQFFDDVICDNPQHPYREKSALIFDILSHLDASKTALVGDTNYDMIAGLKACVKCFGVTWGYGLKENVPNGVILSNSPKMLVSNILNCK